MRIKLTPEEKEKRRRETWDLYYAKNKERIIQKSLNYYEKHKVEICAKRRTDEYRAFQRSWKSRNKDKTRIHKLGNRFHMTGEEYEKLLYKQNCVCAICNQPETAKNKRLAVDHDHETGRIRGLLCMRCNNSLGLMKDSPILLQKMLAYLKSYDFEN